MSPALVHDEITGRPVSVPAMWDLWRVIRWCGIPLVGAGIALVGRSTHVTGRLDSNSERIAAESTSRVSADLELHASISAIQRNLDSSIALQHEILHAVLRERP